MTNLPEAFRLRMKQLLKEEYEAFEESYEKERSLGLRFHTGKGSLEEGLLKTPFELRKIPWVKEGFYYEAGERPGKHPFHDAGVYYIQEPSAMAVVELLNPQPGDVVLDLCAAPGGKSTHIAERLEGRGLVVSNEIHPARAKILSQNIERLGIANGFVTNEDSGRLSEYFPEFFDKMVIDAPCSGEGMFRKDEDARQEWSEDHVKMCAARQREILENGAAMLKPGGRLVYSTCTFAPEENEGAIEGFLREHPEFSIEAVKGYEGFSCGRPEWTEGGREELKNTFRIWPHKVEGEGHYMAVLRKAPAPEIEEKREKKGRNSRPALAADKASLKLWESFKNEFLTGFTEQGRFILFGDELYLLPEQIGDVKGLRILRPGLHLGTIKKNRFEPSHALALHLKPSQAVNTADFPGDSQEILRYLKGETLNAAEGMTKKGWSLVSVDGYSIGWAKQSGGILKNHYPKGLRRLAP